MGKAILHIHSTFSDGEPTVEQILDEVEHHSDIDVVGLTDHDDVRSFRAAREWKARNPDSRVQPLCGLELTTWAFKHILVYIFEEPQITRTIQKFLPLERAVAAAKDAGGLIVVPHVDAVWVGMGRTRLAKQCERLGIDGIELYTPVPFAKQAMGKLREMNRNYGLLELGGSDAHHLEDLYRVIVEFPGNTLEHFHAAVLARTTRVRWGAEGARVPISRQVRQHTKSLIVHPWEQLNTWSREKLAASSRH